MYICITTILKAGWPSYVWKTLYALYIVLCDWLHLPYLYLYAYQSMCGLYHLGSLSHTSWYCFIDNCCLILFLWDFSDVCGAIFLCEKLCLSILRCAFVVLCKLTWYKFCLFGLYRVPSSSPFKYMAIINGSYTNSGWHGLNTCKQHHKHVTYSIIKSVSKMPHCFHIPSLWTKHWVDFI